MTDMSMVSITTGAMRDAKALIVNRAEHLHRGDQLACIMIAAQGVYESALLATIDPPFPSLATALLMLHDDHIEPLIVKLRALAGEAK